MIFYSLSRNCLFIKHKKKFIVIYNESVYKQFIDIAQNDWTEGRLMPAWVAFHFSQKLGNLRVSSSRQRNPSECRVESIIYLQTRTWTSEWD